MTTTSEIRARHDLSPDEVGALEDHLYWFNAARTGQSDGQGLGFVAQDGADVVGAVAGHTWGGVAELRQVWVDEAHRGCGLGRALMQAALDEAARRGCRHLFLTTYDFQAPEFYARLGFEEVARIADKPLGHTEFVMRRALA